MAQKNYLDIIRGDFINNNKSLLITMAFESIVSKTFYNVFAAQSFKVKNVRAIFLSF